MTFGHIMINMCVILFQNPILDENVMDWTRNILQQTMLTVTIVPQTRCLK
jgi:hypothetical protein